MGTKKARSSDAAETVAGNIDMLWEILIRVPLKPLFRLKCVSRQWSTLISDQKFLNSHSQHQRCFPNSLIFSDDDEPWVPPYILSINTTATTPNPRVLNLDFLNQSELTVVRSCNGLLLCRGSYNLATTYFICNPITRNFTTLNLDCQNKSIGLYLAFDPSISPHYKLVSVGPSHDDSYNYWVFRIRRFNPCYRIGPQIFVSTPVALNLAKGVYCNGAIHWSNTGEFSVYFGVNTQRLKIYPMPPPLSGYNSSASPIEYFGESGGRLSMIINIHPTGLSRGNVYDIFELKKDYSGWLLRHHIDLTPIRVEFPHIEWDWFPLSFYVFHTAAKDKEKKSSMTVLIVGGEGAICHDPENKTSRKLCDFKEGTAASVQIQNSLSQACLNGRAVHQHFENLC